VVAAGVVNIQTDLNCASNFEPEECDDVQESKVQVRCDLALETSGPSIRLDEPYVLLRAMCRRVNGLTRVWRAVNQFTCTIMECRHGAASKCSPALHRSAPDTCYSAHNKMRTFRLRGCRATLVGCM
jgi:hypothetical protein